jgi:hypothetical protein
MDPTILVGSQADDPPAKFSSWTQASSMSGPPLVTP